MIRLGMWNRLALVASAVATIAVPLVISEQYVDQAYANREVYFQDCRRANAGTGKDDLNAWLERDGKCMDELIKPLPEPSAGFYWELTYSTAIGCAILYLLIWAIVATAKWIWRGRSIADPPA